MLRVRASIMQAGTLTIHISNGSVVQSLTFDERDIRQANQPLRHLKSEFDKADQQLIEFQTKKGTHD